MPISLKKLPEENVKPTTTGKISEKGLYLLDESE